MRRIMNKKGKKLMDDVENLWRQTKERKKKIDARYVMPDGSVRDLSKEREEYELDRSKREADAKGLLDQITGVSSGQVIPKDQMDFQRKKMKGFMEKRGIFDSHITATAEQIALRKKKEAKALKLELKRKEKRQRGSKTLKKRKNEVPAYLQKLEELTKHKKACNLLIRRFYHEITSDDEWELKVSLQKALGKILSEKYELNEESK